MTTRPAVWRDDLHLVMGADADDSATRGAPSAGDTIRSRRAMTVKVLPGCSGAATPAPSYRVRFRNVFRLRASICSPYQKPK